MCCIYSYEKCLESHVSSRHCWETLNIACATWADNLNHRITAFIAISVKFKHLFIYLFICIRYIHIGMCCIFSYESVWNRTLAVDIAGRLSISHAQLKLHSLNHWITAFIATSVKFKYLVIICIRNIHIEIYITIIQKVSRPIYSSNDLKMIS